MIPSVVDAWTYLTDRMAHEQAYRATGEWPHTPFVLVSRGRMDLVTLNRSDDYPEGS